MAIKNIVPRVDMQGTLGRSDKHWEKVYADDVIDKDGNSLRERLANLKLYEVGDFKYWGGASIPTGWLLCDGSAISRTDYADLFGVIGTLYGAGDGSTTFNLPNLIDRFIEGGTTANVGAAKAAGLPNLAGYFTMRRSYANNSMSDGGGGLFFRESVYQQGTGTWQDGAGGVSYYDKIHFIASSKNAIYGNSTTVQPPAVQVLCLIKY